MSSLWTRLLVIATTCIIYLNYCNGLAYIPFPSHRSNWHTLRAQNGKQSFMAIPHNLGEDPVMVKVQTRLRSGPNKGYIFDAMPSGLHDNDPEAGMGKYGAVVYAYNSTHVLLWAPTESTWAYAFCAGSPGWTDNNGQWSQCDLEVDVMFTVWGPDHFPPSDYDSNWQHFASLAGSDSYKELFHNQMAYPDLVTVQVRSQNPARRATQLHIIADGMGASMVNYYYDFQHYGGVVYGFDENRVRVWAPSEGMEGLTGLFMVSDGWANGSHNMYIPRGDVRVRVWNKLGLERTKYEFEVNPLEDDPDEVLIAIPVTNDKFLQVQVRALDGPNRNFNFPGMGSAQDMGDIKNTRGGLIFGYSGNKFRLFRPRNTNRNGLDSPSSVVHVGTSWGNGIESQESERAIVIIRLLQMADPFQVFPRPTFISGWRRIRAQDHTFSYTTINHNLGHDPIMVRAYVRPVGGANQNFRFEAAGSAQRDDDLGYPDYGAIVYAFNSTHVSLWAPTGTSNAYSLCVKSPGWTDHSGQWSQCDAEVEVMVYVWAEELFPTPEFDSGWLPLRVLRGSDTYKELPHGFGEYPDLVTVQTRSTVPNNVAFQHGLITDGMGASQCNNFYYTQHYGGVIYGYNDEVIRLWAPSEGECGNTFLFLAGDGWGNGQGNTGIVTGDVRVRAWRGIGYLYNLDDMSVSVGTGMQPDPDRIDLQHDVVDDTLLQVQVQALDGPNQGFLFNGLGSAQDDGSINNTYGGLIFGNRQRQIRLFRPSDSKDNGFLINIGSDYGNGINTQSSRTGVARIRLTQMVDPIFPPLGQGNHYVAYESGAKAPETKPQPYRWHLKKAPD